MIRRALGRLVARFDSDEDADSDDAADARFIPSTLDSSIRYAYGGGNADGEREIADVREEADRLAEHHRRK